MNAAEVIDCLIEHEGISRYRLAKRLGVQESLLSRTYNGVSDPGFNEVNDWLKRLGFVLEVKKTDALDDAGSLAIDRFGWTIDAMDKKDYDYLSVHRNLKQLLESKPDAQAFNEVSFRPNQIGNRYWQAFYAATIAYLAALANANVPEFAEVKSNRAPKLWSPIRRTRKSQTDFDKIYANYNVQFPKGELEWI
jgi:hypothetical protein